MGPLQDGGTGLFGPEVEESGGYGRTGVVAFDECTGFEAAGAQLLGVAQDFAEEFSHAVDIDRGVEYRAIGDGLIGELVGEEAVE